MTDQIIQPGFVSESEDIELRKMAEETLYNKEAALTKSDRKFLERVKYTDRRLTKAEQRLIILLWTPKHPPKSFREYDPDNPDEIPF